MVLKNFEGFIKNKKFLNHILVKKNKIFIKIYK